MDIIHGLSNLEIEATNSSSQKEEVKRNWLELPPDIMSLIFLKLDTVDILGSAQWVCSSWWKLSKQPHLFRSIYVEEGLFCNLKLWRKMAREAIDRSCGELVEFSVGSFANDGLLHYMSDKTSSLRSLRLRIDGEFVTDDGLIEIAKKLPHLEELEIIQHYCLDFSRDVIETFGRFCPQLKSCRLNYMSCLLAEKNIDGVALAIAENMPELRHLNLFGNSVTSDVLRTILNGCPHLESLDLVNAWLLNLYGIDLKERCKNIRVWLPIDDEYKCNDPTHEKDATYSTDHGIDYELYTDEKIYESEFDYEFDYQLYTDEKIYESEFDYEFDYELYTDEKIYESEFDDTDDIGNYYGLYTDEDATYSTDHGIDYGLYTDEKIYESEFDDTDDIENYYGYPYDFF